MKRCLFLVVAILAIAADNSFAADLLKISRDGQFVKVEIGDTVLMASSLSIDREKETITFEGTADSPVTLSSPKDGLFVSMASMKLRLQSILEKMEKTPKAE